MSQKLAPIFDTTTTQAGWASYQARTTEREEADRGARRSAEHEAAQQLLAIADPKGALLKAYKKAAAARAAATARRDQITAELADMKAQRPTAPDKIISQIASVNRLTDEGDHLVGGLAEAEAIYQSARAALHEAMQTAIRGQARKTNSEVTRLNDQYKLDILHARQAHARWEGFGRRLERSTAGLDDLLGLV